MSNVFRRKTDVLIIGSGIAGCTAALILAEKGFDILMISAGKMGEDGNSVLAQGGIIYRGEDDDPELLERDILTAGWNMNYSKAVKFLATKGPEVVKELLIEKLKVPFSKKNDHLLFTKEGGHSKKRIIFCADHTGKTIMEYLTSQLKKYPNIHVLDNSSAIDILTTHHHSLSLELKYQLKNQCVGAYVYNDNTHAVETILADFTVIATGGVGQIFLHTTNSTFAFGSGITMAYRAGARILNAEFIQFHPTALFHRSERKFLISEALRGEGARLVNSKGEPFMHKYDSRGDLAPRDIVTRAIVEEMFSTGEECVYLDVANFVKKDIKERFPTIYKKCKEVGIDIEKEPIPVVPAAHYFCGGILVDLKGRTTIDRLYAAGECTCTGVHGANRLASTSLLESVLWGYSVAKDIIKRFDTGSKLSKKILSSMPDWEFSGTKENEDPALIAQDWALIKHIMWNYVGIIRTTSRLKRAFEDLRQLNKRLNEFYKETMISRSIIHLFHAAQTAYIITTFAVKNKKSIGCHFRKN